MLLAFRHLSDSLNLSCSSAYVVTMRRLYRRIKRKELEIRMKKTSDIKTLHFFAIPIDYLCNHIKIKKNCLRNPRKGAKNKNRKVLNFAPFQVCLNELTDQLKSFRHSNWRNKIVCHSSNQTRRGFCWNGFREEVSLTVFAF